MNNALRSLVSQMYYKLNKSTFHLIDAKVFTTHVRKTRCNIVTSAVYVLVNVFIASYLGKV